MQAEKKEEREREKGVGHIHFGNLLSDSLKFFRLLLREGRSREGVRDGRPEVAEEFVGEVEVVGELLLELVCDLQV